MIKTQLRKLAHGLFAGRSRKEQARQHRIRSAMARARCREFMELRYCPQCHLALEAAELFCKDCREASGPLPAAYAVEYARNEFPDLVATREDFDRLMR